MTSDGVRIVMQRATEQARLGFAVHPHMLRTHAAISSRMTATTRVRFRIISGKTAVTKSEIRSELVDSASVRSNKWHTSAPREPFALGGTGDGTNDWIRRLGDWPTALARTGENHCGRANQCSWQAREWRCDEDRAPHRADPHRRGAGPTPRRPTRNSCAARAKAVSAVISRHSPWVEAISCSGPNSFGGRSRSDAANKHLSHATVAGGREPKKVRKQEFRLIFFD
jgi:hypothetical protein